MSFERSAVTALFGLLVLPKVAAASAMPGAEEQEGSSSMHIVVMLIVGLIVGILARFFYPGAVHMGLIASALLGIAGAFLAGFAGRLLQPSTRDQPFHPAGFIYSIIGAIVLIFLGRMLHIIH